MVRLHFALAAAPIAALFAGPSSADDLQPDPAPRYLAHELLDEVESRFEGLLPSSLAGAVDHLYVRDRALEFRHTMEWSERPLELRLRGGRVKGYQSKSYGLRLELRF